MGVKIPSTDNFLTRIQLIQKLITVYQTLQQPQKVKLSQNKLQRFHRELENFRAVCSRPIIPQVKHPFWNRFSLFRSRAIVAQLPRSSQEALRRLAPSTARPNV